MHHIEYLDDINIYDLNVSINEDNLEGLCINCHNEEHFKNEILRDGLYFDEFGNLLEKYKKSPL